MLVYWGILLVPHITDALYYNDCGSQGATVLSVKVSPCGGLFFSVNKGATYIVEITFKTSTDIWGGSVLLDTSVDGRTATLNLRETTLCNHVSPPCPIRAGRRYTFSYSDTVNWNIPTGKVALRWHLTNPYQWPFLCVQILTEIKDGY
ncbi:Phosphatidylglycerol/phosphatidylinositol transfer protein [Clonorchis sinensis]|uniref:Phosphatidylglycerol/phosphatidylinositol transfer protein n=1 Tax=Clonorchis sinensis TaxID=79923 RepID=A0A8T1MWP3_CLOSI|nr:Phosphatidylglycerol/phosphatidylinositol transfer protein [Clonorchis sinensis]